MMTKSIKYNLEIIIS